MKNFIDDPSKWWKVASISSLIFWSYMRGGVEESWNRENAHPNSKFTVKEIETFVLKPKLKIGVKAWCEVTLRHLKSEKICPKWTPKLKLKLKQTKQLARSGNWCESEFIIKTEVNSITAWILRQFFSKKEKPLFA